MTSSNGKIFRVTGPLCGEFTGHRWIPLTKASDAELWCFLWSAPWINGWVNNREAGDLRRQHAHCDVIVISWGAITCTYQVPIKYSQQWPTGWRTPLYHLQQWYKINPFPPLWCGFGFKYVIFKCVVVITFKWMVRDPTDDKSILIQVMAWCRQATNHYLSQCWPRCFSPNGVTRPHWVNVASYNVSHQMCTLMDSPDVFTHSFQGFFTGAGAHARFALMLVT